MSFKAGVLALVLGLIPVGGLSPQAPGAAAATIRVLLETELGDIEVELDAARAPVTVANFLKYVDAGLYDGGRFHRTVRPDNQQERAVRIDVIQAAPNRDRRAEYPPAIPLERTNATGILHKDGTLSMARVAGQFDSGRSEFFICIGDQPSLDYGGARNPDGQGFAAFGRVVRGMDVVRKIQTAPANGESLMPPVRITRARRA
jgi:peptidyl-prolyl cis-trans isomerase A (cyclophilin A)